MIDVRRGDIIFTSYRGDEDHIQRGTRPFLVVSNDIGNKYSETILVCPLTTKEKKEMPTHYVLWPDRTNGITEKSTVLCEQIMTINKKNIIGYVGKVSFDHMLRINTRLLISLGVCL